MRWRNCRSAGKFSLSRNSGTKDAPRQIHRRADGRLPRLEYCRGEVGDVERERREAGRTTIQACLEIEVAAGRTEPVVEPIPRRAVVKVDRGTRHGLDERIDFVVREPLSQLRQRREGSGAKTHHAQFRSGGRPQSRRGTLFARFA